MRFVMVLIWSLLLGSVISYVLTNMTGEAFNFTYVIIIAAFFFLAISILGEGVLKENKEQ